MDTLQPSASKNIALIAVGLALFTALTYTLIARGILSVGDPQVARDGGAIVYVAAGCYLIGNLLILLRNRWLLLLGAFINSLVILFFYSMYQARPEVMFSPGGLVSKLAEILLEILLLVTLVTNWKKSK